MRIELDTCYDILYIELREHGDVERTEDLADGVGRWVSSFSPSMLSKTSSGIAISRRTPWNGYASRPTCARYCSALARSTVLELQ